MNHLGTQLEDFLSRIANSRGHTLTFLSDSGITADQAILLSRIQPDVSLSSLAEALNLSLPSASQMTERLVKLGYVTREESAEDRRRKSLQVTAKARRFLSGFKKVRAEELALGMAGLSEATKDRLSSALQRALKELES